MYKKYEKNCVLVRNSFSVLCRCTFWACASKSKDRQLSMLLLARVAGGLTWSAASSESFAFVEEVAESAESACSYYLVFR